MLGPDHGCMKRCRELVRKLKIGNSVEFTGFCENLVPYYQNGALLLCTSRFEGFPMMILEAKTFGLPVVSAALSYVEILEDGCVQVPQGDGNALANAAIDLLKNEEKRKRLGAEARRDVVENLSGAATFGKYEALLDAIFQGKDAVRQLCSAAAV